VFYHIVFIIMSQLTIKNYIYWILCQDLIHIWFDAFMVPLY